MKLTNSQLVRVLKSYIFLIFALHLKNAQVE